MKKICIVFFLCAFGLVLFNSVCAEISKEGSGDYRSTKSSSRELIVMGEDRLQMNWRQVGWVIDAPANSPFENATYRALGTLHRNIGIYQGTGFVEWICPNGDKIYGSLIIKGSHEIGTSMTGDLVGGTGGCSGIQGTIELKRGPKVTAAKMDMFQGISLGKISWKIP